MSSGVFVIGYGSSLRSDDGVGQYVGAQVAQALGNRGLLAGSLLVEQLLPEYIEDVVQSNAGVLVFVDASQGGRDLSSDFDVEDSVLGSFRISRLYLNPGSPLLGHSLTPQGFLALLKGCYGREMFSLMCSVEVSDVSLGTGFSESLQESLLQLPLFIDFLLPKVTLLVAELNSLPQLSID